MRDFTINAFKLLLKTLKEHDYEFQTFAEFLKNPATRVIILRHDVDARKLNSLQTAQIESDMGIKGTYYFRIVPQSFDPIVISEIASMGHEIGYHYEDMANAKGNIDLAIQLFESSLNKIRQIAPVETICMHGSPLSRFDNREIWKIFNYRKYGIIGEPYFELDLRRILYLTDTGRRWDGQRVSVRDKVEDRIRDESELGMAEEFSVHSTFDIILLATHGILPAVIMINVHPQRWFDNSIPWFKELVIQNLKNFLKMLIVIKNNKRNKLGSN
jgi:hypothetical protein